MSQNEILPQSQSLFTMADYLLNGKPSTGVSDPVMDALEALKARQSASQQLLSGLTSLPLRRAVSIVPPPVGSAANLVHLLFATEREKAMQRQQYLEMLLGQHIRALGSKPENAMLPISVTPFDHNSAPSPLVELKRKVTDDLPTKKSEKPVKKRKIQSETIEEKALLRCPDADGTCIKLNDARWLASLDKLKKYKEKHGDCIVPRGYSPDPRLASWVAEQRYVSR
jgi:hypothetical protein